MSAQTWSAPSDPGPAVTHVRDRLNVVWRHDGDLWWGDIGHGYEDHKVWSEVLARGTLTDITNDIK